MPSTEHPSVGDLQLYLLDRVPTGRSVRIAEHLVGCGPCLEAAAAIEGRIHTVRGALITAQPVQVKPASTALARLPAPVLVRRQALGLGYAAVAGVALSAAIWTELANRTPSWQPAAAMTPRERMTVVPPPVVNESPELTDASNSSAGATADVKPARRAPKRRPHRQFAKPFIEPRSQPPIHHAQLLVPPATLVRVAAPAESLAIARIPTDTGHLPGPPAVNNKRNPLLRFLGVFAKPFRSDRT